MNPSKPIYNSGKRVSSLNSEHNTTYHVEDSLHNVQSLLKSRTHITGSQQMFNVEMLNQILPQLTVFELSESTEGTTNMTKQFICEISSRILFLTVKWAKKLEHHLHIDQTNIVTLLKSKWNILFILGLAQCEHQIFLPHLLASYKSSNGLNSSAETLKIIKRISLLKLDCYEFLFLRLIYLFSAGNIQSASQNMKL